jgi:hypothetical protein
MRAPRNAVQRGRFGTFIGSELYPEAVFCTGTAMEGHCFRRSDLFIHVLLKGLAPILAVVLVLLLVSLD